MSKEMNLCPRKLSPVKENESLNHSGRRNPEFLELCAKIREERQMRKVDQIL